MCIGKYEKGLEKVWDFMIDKTWDPWLREWPYNTGSEGGRGKFGWR